MPPRRIAALLALLFVVAAGYAIGPRPAPVPHQAGDSELEGEVRWGYAAGLHFVEVVPEGVDPSEELPLIVMVHGMGDRARPVYGLRAVQGTRARFILPQAPNPYNEGYSWLPHRIASEHPSLLAAIPERAEQVGRMIDSITAMRSTRGEPVITGFSQGGILSYAVALLEPETVGLAIPIAGYLPVELWPAHDDVGSYPPIRALHGTADPVVTYDPTREMADTLRDRGLDVTLHPFEGVEHRTSSEMRRTLYDNLASYDAVAN